MDNILENNKLIAEFMELEGQHEEWCGNNILEFNELIGEDELRSYSPDKRWDDLMPVVDKIESLGYFSHIKSGQRKDGKYKRHYMSIYCDETDIEISEVYIEEDGSKLEVTYKSVIEFINWHKEDGNRNPKT